MAYYPALLNLLHQDDVTFVGQWNDHAVYECICAKY